MTADWKPDADGCKPATPLVTESPGPELSSKAGGEPEAADRGQDTPAEKGRRPELLATASTLDELKRLAEAGADALLVGGPPYAARAAGPFDPGMIRAAARFLKPRGKRLYVLVNHLLDNAAVEALPAYIRMLAEAGADAVECGDPAVLVTVREMAPNLRIHWNAEMTATNALAAEFWGKRGASRAVLARELNGDEIRAFRAKTTLEVQVQVHGMTCIYHSKRRLVESYLEHAARTGRTYELRGPEGTDSGCGGGPAGRAGLDRGLRLIETERPDIRLPIFEDEAGTHIMSPDDICLLEVVHELLEIGVDSLKIEGLLKTPAYNEAAVRAYRAAIDEWLRDPAGYRFREEWLEPIRALQDPRRELTFGFYFKEQVY
ncbi:peptidase U32 family protein [Thermobacillus sp. ZCTH02-B1]|uniref:peptidase U32 family protein n=1 Tax=Thermobacillus sp. ZCTH02-B1 TaxID=1858795 RepID=UPI0025E5991A|nr:peptidase U32 family protein [Thermobacillus sp. ZCTH02-B1]